VDVVRALGEKSFATLVVIDERQRARIQRNLRTSRRIAPGDIASSRRQPGKGAALRTGINYALCTSPDSAGVVTADADGQHHPDDIEAVGVRLLAQTEQPGSGMPNVRSRCTLAQPLRQHSHQGRDARPNGTQVGATPKPVCEAFPYRFALRVLKLESTGYDFETEMLIAAHQLSVPVVEEAHPHYLSSRVTSRRISTRSWTR
jgi:hypothetical protein